MKKGLAVFSGSAVVHKLMQDGTVVLGTAANPAAVTVSGNVNVTGQMTASANSVLVGNIGGEFTNTTLGGILVELKNAAATGTGTLSSSLKSYIDTQDQAEASARSALSSSMKSYIDTQDQAEASARSSADSALQTSLSNASSSLKTYIDGIDTAQTSANAALSSSLKTHIDAADAVLQSAIDAEKARIDTILSGADINLDQFVEVVQFVNDLSGANYEALMDAVTDINNSIDAVSGALAQEITDRETAVAGVQSNLDSLSGSVSSSLAAEVTARIAGDAAVQSNLDSVSGSLKAAIDAIQLGASGDTTALSSSLKSYVDGLDAAQTAANSGLSSSLKTYIDAQDVADAAAWAAADASLSGTLSGALAAEVLRATAAEGVLQTNLNNASSSLKLALDVEEAARIAGDSALSTRLTALENFDGEAVHVDNVNGVDAVGRGTVLRPFKTINYAYSQIPAVSGATDLEKVTQFVAEKIVIKLAPGTYTENVQLGFKRARMALVGNGARIVGDAKMQVLKADFPVASLEGFKATNPAPWTGFSAQMCFEIAGEAGGGLESDPTANVLTVTGLTSIEFENGGANYNWDSQHGQFYCYFDNTALVGGFNMKHDNTVATARAPSVVVEVESSKVGSADVATRSYFGYVPWGASTTVPTYGGLTAKIHNSTIASAIGPKITIGEIDGCRVYDFDRTMGGVVTNGSIDGSTSTSYLGIVNTQFRAYSGTGIPASVYKIGSSTGNVTYKIDAVSHGTLTVGRTLDIASGRTVSYTFLDRAAGVLVVASGSLTSTNVQSALEELQGDINVLNTSLTSNSSSLSSALAAEISRATTAEAGLQTSINTEKARIDAILSGSTADLDQFKEVVDFINSISGTNATALANSISNVSSSLSSALGAEINRATTAEAGLQAQIDAAAFTVNGLSVEAKSGSFEIVAGSSNVVITTSGSDKVVVDLASSVTLGGTLTANVVSASAGLSVVGGASVAGGMTVSSGDVVVSHGVSKTILDSSADSVRLTALSDATNLAAGEFDGMSFYLKGAAVGAFARPNCWYFCQDGEWFDAPFYAGE